MKFVAMMTLLAVTAGFAVPVFAHGDEPHPKCKAGYVLTDDHRCVKQ